MLSYVIKGAICGLALYFLAFSGHPGLHVLFYQLPYAVLIFIAAAMVSLFVRESKRQILGAIMSLSLTLMFTMMFVG